MRILITSFGPFNNFKTNPSNQIMEIVREKTKLFSPKNNYYEFETIDVSWSSVSKFINEKKDGLYDLIIHLGVATNENKMRIEIMGRNVQSGNDVENIKPNENQIIKNVSDLKTNIPMEILNDFVSKNDFIELSHNAGSFLCNYIYFKSLYAFKKNSLVLFIHTADNQNKPKSPNLKYQAEKIFNLIEILINKNNLITIS